MIPRSRLSRRVLILFGGAVIPVAAAFVWLGWRLVQHETEVTAQHQQQRLDAAADLAAAAILRQTAAIGTGLATIATAPVDDAIPAARRMAPEPTAGARLVVIDADRVAVLPAGGVAYYPMQTAADPPERVFAAAESYEFTQRDPSRAVRALAPLAADANDAVRAGALLRLGRSLQKLGQSRDAIAAYERLDTLGDTRVGGLPAALVSRYARCALLEKLNQRDRLAREAAALLAGLQEGRWQIDRATYLFYSRAAQRWTGAVGDSGDSSPPVALAAAIDLLWAEWREVQAGRGEPGGVRSAGSADRPLLLMWRAVPSRLVAFVAGPEYVERQWLAAARSTDGVGVRLTVAAGDAGPAGVETRAGVAVRTAEDTGLPWRLHAARDDPEADHAEIAVRRRLIVSVVALVGITLLASGYAIRRAIAREVGIVRLQGDFVAAVSHEFRSPLTSMRQVSELLASGRVTSEERRGAYYTLLTRESQRLQRLVEGLLDFGRAEAGAGEHRRDPLDLAKLVRDTVSEFRVDAGERGFTIELAGADSALPIRGDAEALSRALWNLFDNAVKYSPESRTIWVTVARSGDRVSVAVRDRGTGIAAGETEAIFARFVRGASARATGAKGTGLGLAMVRHIARGHGGDVAVESEPGSGSTFTMSLPLEGKS